MHLRFLKLKCCCYLRRLDGNHLQCDCRLSWLARMLSNFGGRIQAAATCHGPRRLAGRSIASVAIDDMTCDDDDIGKFGCRHVFVD